jgi:hypothetical protein
MKRTLVTLAEGLIAAVVADALGAPASLIRRAGSATARGG